MYLVGIAVALHLVLSIQGGTVPPVGVRPLQDICKEVKGIEEDETLFDKYYQCLVDVGPCTQDSKKLKDVIQEALERNCARCSASQRRSAINLLKLTMECRPAQFHELEKRFDPRGTFMKKYKRRSMGVGWGASVPEREMNI